jgi:hypothetical protein
MAFVAHGGEVLRITLKRLVSVIRNDVMHLKVIGPPAGDAGRLPL